ncbi:hypothetical protein Gogos_011006 [Gossypium gossypioides]|uniref:Uncharacterized protein n=1 Tax=Gossypium gossypioides TaxID=34282 RepID=A0A7J9BN01_GOSGO|nr:hypothetical protein [Gossypium gossypioides]
MVSVGASLMMSTVHILMLKAYLATSIFLCRMKSVA